MNVPGTGPAPGPSGGASVPGGIQGEIGDVFGGSGGGDLVYYFNLMKEAMLQNQLYSLATNIVKMRHDTAKAAVNNVRSS